MRTGILFLLAFLSTSHSDVLSSMGKFWFLNPGITLTKEGPGFEISGGRNGLGSGEASLLGALVRYEPSRQRVEAGFEGGATIFLVEAGFSHSDQGTGFFIAPDLAIPIPTSKDNWLVVNLCYRIYPAFSDANTFGASLKFAWLH